MSEQTEHEEEFAESGCESSASQDNPLMQTGSILISHKGKILDCLTIIGQIEGHDVLPPRHKTTKYEHIIPLLVSIEEDERIDGLLVLLNTVGGDVEAGLAIAEVISGMKKPTVSIVLGGGHSIGIPLQDRITGFVVEHSRISAERYGELVLNTGELVTDVGTILDGEDAVREGLVDAVGTVSDAIEALHAMTTAQ